MSYYITYSSLDQFVPVTVHTADTHNTPHNRLLNNDVTLDTALYGVASRVTTLENVAPPPAAVVSTLVRIVPVLIYRMTSAAGIWWPTYAPYNVPPYSFHEISSYKEYPAGEGQGYGVWVTHSYPAALPVSARSILLNIGIISRTDESGAMVLRASLFPQDTVCESISRSNNDDSCADNVTIEMPYEPSRAFQSICLAWRYPYFSIAAVGYRT